MLWRLSVNKSYTATLKYPHDSTDYRMSFSAYTERENELVKLLLKTVIDSQERLGYEAKIVESQTVEREFN